MTLAYAYVTYLPAIDDDKSYRPTHVADPFLFRADVDTHRILDCRFKSDATDQDPAALQFFSHFVVGHTLESLSQLTPAFLTEQAKTLLSMALNFEFVNKLQFEVAL